MRPKTRKTRKTPRPNPAIPPSRPLLDNRAAFMHVSRFCDLPTIVNLMSTDWNMLGFYCLTIHRSFSGDVLSLSKLLYEILILKMALSHSPNSLQTSLTKISKSKLPHNAFHLLTFQPTTFYKNVWRTCDVSYLCDLVDAHGFSLLNNLRTYTSLLTDVPNFEEHRKFDMKIFISKKMCPLNQHPPVLESYFWDPTAPSDILPLERMRSYLKSQNQKFCTTVKIPSPCAHLRLEAVQFVIGRRNVHLPIGDNLNIEFGYNLVAPPDTDKIIKSFHESKTRTVELYIVPGHLITDQLIDTICRVASNTDNLLIGTFPKIESSQFLRRNNLRRLVFDTFALVVPSDNLKHVQAVEVHRLSLALSPSSPKVARDGVKYTTAVGTSLILKKLAAFLKTLPRLSELVLRNMNNDQMSYRAAAVEIEPDVLELSLDCLIFDNARPVNLRNIYPDKSQQPKNPKPLKLLKLLKYRPPKNIQAGILSPPFDIHDRMQSSPMLGITVETLVFDIPRKFSSFSLREMRFMALFFKNVKHLVWNSFDFSSIDSFVQTFSTVPMETVTLNCTDMPGDWRFESFDEIVEFKKSYVAKLQKVCNCVWKLKINH